MPRPTSISHEKIIRAAREVFLEKGMQATTAEVARRAGVAEGTLFYKFKSKFDLFKAAMTAGRDEPEFVTVLVDGVGKGELRENLITAVCDGIGFLRTVLPLMLMSWSNQGAVLPAMMLEPSPPPLKLLRRLSSVFEAEMRLGRVQRRDPEVLARVIIGAMFHYVFFELLMSAHAELPMPVASYARGVVGALCDGIAPAASKSESQRMPTKSKSKSKLRKGTDP